MSGIFNPFGGIAARGWSKSIKVRSRETCQCCFIPEILQIDGCSGMGSLLRGRTIFLPQSGMKFLSCHTKLGGDTDVVSFFLFFSPLCVTPCLHGRVRIQVLDVCSESRRPSFVVDISSRNRFALINVNEADQPT